eukprot:TRINITY_DN4115_c0_g1_i1.p1 TRINITY_DN4115_c0_g1~~TRINITY_DN4115_c0_g1_i1.p1  ORF type:complete len:462 (+),score=207.63 TRINITY_DN4115_c0_g1_i1:281-1666(+)
MAAPAESTSSSSSETQRAAAAAGEGGADGAELAGVFYCEFDNKAGPKVVCQYPPGLLRPEVFEATREYFITKPQLAGRVISLVAYGWRFMGCAVKIESSRYERNFFLFNVCFVFAAQPDDGDDGSQQQQQQRGRHTQQQQHATVHSGWERVVRKVARCMRSLETDGQLALLSSDDSPVKPRLGELLGRLVSDLRHRAECQLSLSQFGAPASSTLSVKLLPLRRPPPAIDEHQVPVLVRQLRPLLTADWELAVQRCVPYVDGVRHVRAIAQAAHLPPTLVIDACRHLHYYGCLRIIDVFQYSNAYAPTARLHLLRTSLPLQRLCVRYVAADDGAGGRRASIEQLLALYAALKPGTSLADFCLEHDLVASDIDLRRFITFGLCNGLIRRQHKRPLLLGSGGAEAAARAASDAGPTDCQAAIGTLPGGGRLDGSRTLDALASAAGLPADDIERSLAPGAVVFLK